MGMGPGQGLAASAVCTPVSRDPAARSGDRRRSGGVSQSVARKPLRVGSHLPAGGTCPDAASRHPVSHVGPSQRPHASSLGSFSLITCTKQ